MKIRILDIDELNERLAELEAWRDDVNEAREALSDAPEEDKDDAQAELDSAEQAFSADEQAELSELESLKGDIGERRGKIDTDGAPFVHEGDFEDYARELAEDIGAIDRDAGWPLGCIDWAKAADQIKMDYSAVEFRGVTYLYRA